MRLPFNGPFAESFSSDANAQITQNWYPEVTKSGKSSVVLYPTPGTLSWGFAGTGPIRAFIVVEDLLYTVSGNNFYSLDITGVLTNLGALNTTSGKASIAKDADVIIIVDGTNGYTYDIAKGSFQTIVDSNFPDGATHVEFFDRYFIVDDPNNTNALGVDGAFFISELTKTTSSEFSVGEYDNKSVSVTAEDAAPKEVTFGDSGTKMYIVGTTNDTVYQYTLSTAWDVGTASYASKSKSVGSEATFPTGLALSSDGTKMYVVGGNVRTIWRYTLSTAWDVSTAGATDQNFSIVGTVDSEAILFGDSGTKMYLLDSHLDRLYQYTLGTAWDVTTAAYDSKFTYTGSQETSPTGAAFNSDGTKLYIVGSINNTVYQYTLSTAWDSLTARYTGASVSVASEEGTTNGVTFGDSGTKMYIVGSTNDTVYQYDTSMAVLSWNALDYAVAERDPDKLKALIVNHRNLWLIGEYSTEVWYNSGDLDFTFEPIPQAYLEWGILAPDSLAKSEGALFWLAKHRTGQHQVVMTNGFNIVVISNHDIENKIASKSNPATADAFVMRWKGHTWYVLSFSDETFVYDLTIQDWFTWSHGTYGRYLANVAIPFDNKTLVGDYVNGNIYELSDSTYTDNGTTITRKRRTPHLHTEGKSARHNKVELIVESGVGDNTTLDPQIMLRWSDDGAHTWSSEYWESMGKKGVTYKRIRWAKLGRTQNRVYELVATDPVKYVIIDAYAEVDTGERDVS